MTLDLSSAPGDEANGDDNYFFHSRYRRPVLKDKSTDSNHPRASNPAGSDSREPGEENTANERQENDANSTFQIIEFDSAEPLVSYKGHVFRCSWRTGLGTDLLFSAPDVKPEGVKALIEDSKFNLLAATNIKLIGHAAELTEKPIQHVPSRKRAHRTGKQSSSSEPRPQGSFESDESDSLAVQTKKYKILLEENAGGSRKKQASFLEDMMAAKAARGETDEVYLGRRKEYVVDGESEPRNGRSSATQSRKHREEGSPQEDSADDTPKRRRPVKRRARKSSSGGGLFRDFEPEEPPPQEVPSEVVPIEVPQTPEPVAPSIPVFKFHTTTPDEMAKDYTT